MADPREKVADRPIGHFGRGGRPAPAVPPVPRVADAREKTWPIGQSDSAPLPARAAPGAPLRAPLEARGCDGRGRAIHAKDHDSAAGEVDNFARKSRKRLIWKATGLPEGVRSWPERPRPRTADEPARRAPPSVHLRPERAEFAEAVVHQYLDEVALDASLFRNVENTALGAPPIAETVELLSVAQNAPSSCYLENCKASEPTFRVIPDDEFTHVFALDERAEEHVGRAAHAYTG